MRELRGARRGHINRLAEHPRHPVVSPVVLIVVMAMWPTGPPILYRRELCILCGTGQAGANEPMQLQMRFMYSANAFHACCKCVSCTLQKPRMGARSGLGSGGAPWRLMSALADYIQAALMLNYNDRVVG